MPPGRVVGPWLRASLARIPPIPALRVGGNGLMEGTPGNTLAVNFDGGVVGSVTMFLPPHTRIHVLLSALVVWGRGHHTPVVSEVNVTTTKGRERQGRGFRLFRRFAYVPFDTHNTVRVNVTAIVANTMVMTLMIVPKVLVAAASHERCKVVAIEGVAGTSAGVGWPGSVRRVEVEDGTR